VASEKRRDHVAELPDAIGVPIRHSGTSAGISTRRSSLRRKIQVGEHYDGHVMPGMRAEVTEKTAAGLRPAPAR
jgi:hypothetical protein